MQLKACLSLALVSAAVAHQPPSAHLRASHASIADIVPLPAAYKAWRPDPNEKIDASWLQKHQRKHKKGAKDGLDDDGFPDMSRFFKVREPKQTFKMDEASTISFDLLKQVAAPSYLQFANSESQSHKLGDAKQAKVVESLRRGLKGFQAGGHDFMLDAAVANNPGTTEKQLRSRLINMMQVLLKNATKVEPPAPAKRHHGLPAGIKPWGEPAAAPKAAAKATVVKA